MINSRSYSYFVCVKIILSSSFELNREKKRSNSNNGKIVDWGGKTSAESTLITLQNAETNHWFFFFSFVPCILHHDFWMRILCMYGDETLWHFGFPNIRSTFEFFGLCSKVNKPNEHNKHLISATSFAFIEWQNDTQIVHRMIFSMCLCMRRRKRDLHSITFSKRRSFPSISDDHPWIMIRFFGVWHSKWKRMQSANGYQACSIIFSDELIESTLVPKNHRKKNAYS